MWSNDVYYIYMKAPSHAVRNAFVAIDIRPVSNINFKQALSSSGTSCRTLVARLPQDDLPETTQTPRHIYSKQKRHRLHGVTTMK